MAVRALLGALFCLVMFFCVFFFLLWPLILSIYNVTLKIWCGQLNIWIFGLHLLSWLLLGKIEKCVLTLMMCPSASLEVCNHVNLVRLVSSRKKLLYRKNPNKLQKVPRKHTHKGARERTGKQATTPTFGKMIKSAGCACGKTCKKPAGPVDPSGQDEISGGGVAEATPRVAPQCPEPPSSRSPSTTHCSTLLVS